jgi:hypothetical protein
VSAVPTRAELDALIRARVAADPQFRQRLLSEPREALNEITGLTVPNVVTVEVHEESLTQVHLVIPAVLADGEIAEEDLELVAGGSACWDNCGCSI